MVLLPSLLVATGVVSAQSVKWYDLHVRLAKAESRLHRLCVAVEAMKVDMCRVFPPEAGNAPPTMLTTPIAYLAPIPSDPFGNGQEPFFYAISSMERCNQSYILASRGPDRDLDLSRLPATEQFYPTTAVHRAVYYLERGRFESWKPDHRDNSAAPRYSPPYMLRVLPDDLETSLQLGTRDEKRRCLSEFLHTHGVAIYDPTNGATSDGDVIYWEMDSAKPWED
ncbi:MAG: hypothetical protein RLY93_01115 [Sumerlaeia bacterium]